MDTLDDFLMRRPPTASRPLLGITVLVVEDSRFACEALRLLCLRSGARIRRADSLDSARRHLRVYRPTCAIVDLGLPDGPGESLIAELAGATPAIQVLLATSGDPDAEERALAAGAHGFLAKPVSSIGVFQQLILEHLPPEQRPLGPRAASAETVVPDPLAFRDDLAAVAGKLSGDAQDRAVDYAAQFLAGLARSAGDRALADAVAALKARRALGRDGRDELDRVNALVKDRLATSVEI